MNTPLRTLVIEDSEEDAILVVRELTRAGFDISFTRVDTTPALLDALDNKVWDLIIADYSLPSLGGLDALTYMRERKLDIPFIIVSGTIGEGLAVDAMRAGAHDYILKGNYTRLVPAVEREIRDAAVRRQKAAAEEQLRAATLLLAKTFDSLSEAVFVMDPENHTVLRCNDAAGRIFGYTTEALTGRTLASLFPSADDYQSFKARCLESLAHTSMCNIVWQLRKSTGEHLHTEHFVTFLRDDHRNITALMHVIRDVTARTLAELELRKSEQQMRALAARLQSVREEERARIAREIHDELGGALTGLKMDLAFIRKRLRDKPEGGYESSLERAQAMNDLLDGTIGTVRRIASELRPGILDDLGLVAAIDWQAKEFSRRTGITCICSSKDIDGILSQATATALFRIFQETLTNVARHSGAHNVKVTLLVEGQDVLLTITDDGRGISADEILNTTSLGLVGMRERAEMLGGSFAIAPAREKGTTVRVRIPCGADEPQLHQPVPGING